MALTRAEAEPQAEEVIAELQATWARARVRAKTQRAVDNPCGLPTATTTTTGEHYTTKYDLTRGPSVYEQFQKKENGIIKVIFQP
jgi:hypothetical protein